MTHEQETEYINNLEASKRILEEQNATLVEKVQQLQSNAQTLHYTLDETQNELETLVTQHEEVTE